MSETRAMTESSLASLLMASAVTELAGPRSYARGLGYHHDGRVELGAVGEHRVDSVVRGTMPYHVALWADDGVVAWSCSCPMGDAGNFCKHCVAVALVVFEGASTDAPKRPAPTKDRKKRPPEVDVQVFVESLDAAELVDLVMGQVKGDWRLRERLVARAAAEAGTGIDVRQWRKRLDGVFAPYGDFVAYQEAEGWAGEVGEVIDALVELVDAGHQDAVIGLAEHAHGLADAAMQYVDDSDGSLTDISARLGELHLRACELGTPDRVELARRLVNLELTSELDAFHRGAATYADVLGPEGLEEYARLVEPRWRDLDERSTDDEWSTDRFQVREAMIGIALASGDPDELIRVKQQDLRSPGDYLEVAEQLRSPGRLDDAAEWARRGLDAYAKRSWQTGRLREFLAELLRETDDLDSAIELFWDAFEMHPGLDAYRRLLSEADLAGPHDEWSRRAIETLRGRVGERRPEEATARSTMTPTPAVALIEILLFEGDIEAAWVIAVDHGCAPRLWLTLARAREDDHPEEVIPIYEREVFDQIETKKNHGYRTAVDLLARIRAAADRAGRPERFDQVLGEVRTRHKAKRNLMALLNERDW